MMPKANKFQETIEEAYIYTQEQFTSLYNGYLRFANAYARRFFRDMVLREAAAEEAVTKAFDKWWRESPTEPVDDERMKRVIRNSLQYASKTQKLEPIPCDMEGFHGYRIIE